jgi:hypothetical protein
MGVFCSFHLKNDASGASGRDANLHLWWSVGLKPIKEKNDSKKDAN